MGNLEYLAQSNDNANCVKCDERYKFVDDLTVLEKINLLIIGMASHNPHSQIPNDILSNNKIIPAENLETQKIINHIQQWTNNKKMILNEKKTKAMVFNFTKKHQFTTRLQLKNKNIEIVNETKLLGTIISNDLKWHKNTQFLVKKAWGRMQLLRSISSFKASIKDKLDIYKKFIRSHAEQSCTVWTSGLTKGNEKDIERIQKSAVRLILGKKYTTYSEALEKLNIKTLKERRKILCVKFAQKCLKEKKTKGMFRRNTKEHHMRTRYPKKYEETKARTMRMKNFTIPYMQKLLNSQ